MKLTREIFIPKNSIEKIWENLNVATYSYEKDGKFYCYGFSGKKAKPDFNFYFKSLEQQEKYITEWVERHSSRQKVKEDRKAKRLAFQHTLKVGDILECSWGYDQTNIDFYQVIELVGKKSVKIREIGAKDVEYEGYGSMTGKKVAIKDNFINEEILLKKVGEGNFIRINSFSWASLWDGKPCRYSWYA